MKSVVSISGGGDDGVSVNMCRDDDGGSVNMSVIVRMVGVKIQVCGSAKICGW